jgi:hypothetical protein
MPWRFDNQDKPFDAFVFSLLSVWRNGLVWTDLVLFDTHDQQSDNFWDGNCASQPDGRFLP